MKKTVYICTTESLGCTPETNTTLQINYTSKKKKRFKKQLEKQRSVHTRENKSKNIQKKQARRQ